MRAFLRRSGLAAKPSLAYTRKVSNAATTQALTDDMIHELREEAGAAGDDALGHICDVALGNEDPVTTANAFEDRYGGGDMYDAQRAILACDSVETARGQCAAAITSARAMDDDTPMVQVVA